MVTTTGSARDSLGHVLVVDDDREYREVLAQVLRDMGWAVSTAGDGEAALALLEGHEPPDLILLDMVMPNMDGVEFLGRLRNHAERELSRTPVVVMTGMPHHARLLLEPHSSDGMLVKPFSLRDLRATLAHFSPPGGRRRQPA